LKDVFITRVAKFLPNQPVHSDDIEQYLGMVDGKPSKARRIVLRNNAIKTRYYAIDKQGNTTHTNAELAKKAIDGLFDNELNLKDIELLACGTSIPDQILPSHAAMVHGLLGGKPIEIISTSGVCCAGMHALKYAYMSLQTGNSGNAVAVASEFCSPLFLAKNFQDEVNHLNDLEKNPIIAFEKDFLRWMLSDGAGAALLQDKPNKNGISLKIDWLESISFANELETCMYAGAEKQTDKSIKGWKEFEAKDWLNKSIFSIKQDVKILDKYIASVGVAHMAKIFDKRGIDVKKIDYCLPHISSEYFRSKVEEEMIKNNVLIPQERWFTNLSQVGNVGSASIYLMLEELFNSDKLKKDEKILLLVPESGRFSYSYAHLTVC
jgi:3-oxoacyl-[acyl-carrier-protein] synthase-3